METREYLSPHDDRPTYLGRRLFLRLAGHPSSAFLGKSSRSVFQTLHQVNYESGVEVAQYMRHGDHVHKALLSLGESGKNEKK
jgi:hypothetical protein